MSISLKRTFLAISIFFFQFISAQHFEVSIEQTGESSLLIIQESISYLEIGDEVGVFDSSGIIDDSGNVGEVLVGAGIWSGQQLEIVNILSVDCKCS